MDTPTKRPTLNDRAISDAALHKARGKSGQTPSSGTLTTNHEKTMQTENDTSKHETDLKQETGEGCPGASCSRLFRVQVTFDTVIYAKDEKAAKQLVKYGTGEIDDMPVSVIAMPIESRDGLPAGWNAKCIPWGNAPENTTIGEILNANVKVMASPLAGATVETKVRP